MDGNPIRVLYSFPHRIGAGRICYTAWQQVAGLHAAGAAPVVHPASVHRPLPDGIEVRPTLARGRVRVPYRARRPAAGADPPRPHRRPPAAGARAGAWTSSIRGRSARSRRSRRPAGSGSRPCSSGRTPTRGSRTRSSGTSASGWASSCRPTTSTPSTRRYSSARSASTSSPITCSVPLSSSCRRSSTGATRVSELSRHIYGYDEDVFFPRADGRDDAGGLTMLYVGVAAVRKGLHFALDAWLRSPASRTGTFLIAGEMLPSYGARLGAALEHPSVRVLGHRDDIAELMRASDLLVLPSIEEGFGLVCTEAIGSGCVPLVSDACTDLCRHSRMPSSIGSATSTNSKHRSRFCDRDRDAARRPSRRLPRDRAVRDVEGRWRRSPRCLSRGGRGRRQRRWPLGRRDTLPTRRRDAQQRGIAPEKPRRRGGLARQKFALCEETDHFRMPPSRDGRYY